MNLVIKLEDFPGLYEIELQVELAVLYQTSGRVDASFNVTLILFDFLIEDYANSSSDCCREGNEALHVPWDMWCGNNHMVLPTSS